MAVQAVRAVQVHLVLPEMTSACPRSAPASSWLPVRAVLASLAAREATAAPAV
jgi:hypothetical protein